MTPSPAPAGSTRVLVAFASRHGGTRQIAATIASALRSVAPAGSRGMSTVLAPVELWPDPTRFDAVVLGSAVYGGRWLDQAVRWTEAWALALRGTAPGCSPAGWPRPPLSSLRRPPTSSG